MWVLVIDDIASNTYFMTEALRSINHNAVVASDAGEALQLMDQMAFDCVIVDYHMPNVSGASFLATVRERMEASGRWIPVFVMTADNDPELLDDVRRLGARDILRKPVSIRALDGALEGLGIVVSDPASPAVKPPF